MVNVKYPEIPNGTDFTNRKLINQWKSTDWSAVRKTVNNLQSRLARAAKNCDWFKVGVSPTFPTKQALSL